MKDPYLYEDSDVLINKLNIRDNEKLNEAELDFAYIKTIELKAYGYEINGIDDFLKIHELIFLNIYDWAGKIRTIDIYKSEPILNGKSIDYAYASYINQALKELDKEFKCTDWNKLNVQEKVVKICYFVSEFWHIHPFREGNTRTTAMVLYLLIKKYNFHINDTFFSKHASSFRNALVLSCLYNNEDKDYLLNLIHDAVTFKNVNNGKYQNLENEEVAKYSYKSHTIQKIETIKKI